MNALEKQIRDIKVKKGEVLLYWMGGAGYIIKTENMTYGLDLYLSNACEQDNDMFKRLVPAPANAENLKLDFLLSSHEHGDHLDEDSIHSFISKDNKTILVGPRDVVASSKRFGLDQSRVIELNRNETIEIGDMKIRTVTADHADLAPDAIGLIMEVSGKTIYFTGDTCFRTDIKELIELKEDIDVMLVPINGQYGNPDSLEAAYFAQLIKPKVVIPCHYWLFKEHGGDPGQFVKCAEEKAPLSKVKVLAVGEA